MTDKPKTPDEAASPAPDDPIATSILDVLSNGGTSSFQDIAKVIATARARPKDSPELWRRYLPAVKQQAIHLARGGRIEIIRKGKPVDPKNFKGIVRLRLKED